MANSTSTVGRPEAAVKITRPRGSLGGRMRLSAGQCSAGEAGGGGKASQGQTHRLSPERGGDEAATRDTDPVTLAAWDAKEAEVPTLAGPPLGGCSARAQQRQTTGRHDRNESRMAQRLSTNRLARLSGVGMLDIMARGYGALKLALALFGAAMCGGQTAVDLPDSAGGGGRSSTLPNRAGRDAASSVPWTPAVDGGEDVRSEYVEPDCPDGGYPVVTAECDLFNPWSGCPLGQACYAVVEYPDQTDPCSVEQYGARCRPEGRGEQGAACSNHLCAGGFACVDTGQGTQCVKLCRMGVPSDCPPGLICFALDVVAGVGGCL
jgi:hypothetical protein